MSKRPWGVPLFVPFKWCTNISYNKFKKPFHIIVSVLFKRHSSTSKVLSLCLSSTSSHTTAHNVSFLIDFFLKRHVFFPLHFRIFRHTLEKRAAFRPDHFTGREQRAEIRSFLWKPAFPDENRDMEVKTSGCLRNRAYVSRVHQKHLPLSESGRLAVWRSAPVIGWNAVAGIWNRPQRPARALKGEIKQAVIWGLKKESCLESWSCLYNNK